MLSDIASELLSVEGITSLVSPLKGNPDLIIIENKWETSSGYSGNIYDVQGSTFNGIVYPSVDPAIFEVKYPDIDIMGRVMGDY